MIFNWTAGPEQRYRERTGCRFVITARFADEMDPGTACHIGPPPVRADQNSHASVWEAIRLRLGAATSRWP